MGRTRFLILGAVLVLAAARVVAYFTYAGFGLASRFEIYDLEAKMVLLAYRVQAGAGLYPAWQEYPHVSNFYGPVYFALVGGVGRLVGADASGLFLIGRLVTFLAALGTTALIGLHLWRSHGRGAAVAGALLSLGAAPMIGFSVMVRPDLLAEFLGLAGFFLATGSWRGRGWLESSVLLILAALTKQSALLFLFAAVAALVLQGERRPALRLLLVGLVGLGGTVAGLGLVAGPNAVSCLLGDATTPWSFSAWRLTMIRLATMSPDLLITPVLGLILWGVSRGRDVRWATLGVCLLVSSVVTSAKEGSDLNYGLSLRIVEALAVGTLWSLVVAAGPMGQRFLAGTAAALVVIVCLPSLRVMVEQADATIRISSQLQGPLGRSLDRTLAWVRRVAEDPDSKVLTDSPMIELYQKERAAFGDPFLFRLQVETGQIRPVRMQRWIETEAYDLIITRRDLFSSIYAVFEFGLPMPLVETARAHYVPAGRELDLYFYRPAGRRVLAGP